MRTHSSFFSALSSSALASTTGSSGLATTSSTTSTLGSSAFATTSSTTASVGMLSSAFTTVSSTLSSSTFSTTSSTLASSTTAGASTLGSSTTSGAASTTSSAGVATTSSTTSSTFSIVSLASFLQHSSKFSTRSGTSSSSSASFPGSSIPSAVGTLEANFFKCVNDSAPNWFRMPGNKSVICLFSPCPVTANVLAAREDCSFLSSVVAVLCTTFFFLRAVPLPPMRTWA